MCSEDVSQGLGNADQWLALAWHSPDTPHRILLKQTSWIMERYRFTHTYPQQCLALYADGLLMWLGFLVLSFFTDGDQKEVLAKTKLLVSCVSTWTSACLDSLESERLGPAYLYPLYIGYIPCICYIFIYKVYIYLLYSSHGEHPSNIFIYHS